MAEDNCKRTDYELKLSEEARERSLEGARRIYEFSEALRIWREQSWNSRYIFD